MVYQFFLLSIWGPLQHKTVVARRSLTHEIAYRLRIIIRTVKLRGETAVNRLLCICLHYYRQHSTKSKPKSSSRYANQGLLFSWSSWAKCGAAFARSNWVFFRELWSKVNRLQKICRNQWSDKDLFHQSNTKTRAVTGNPGQDNDHDTKTQITVLKHCKLIEN